MQGTSTEPRTQVAVRNPNPFNQLSHPFGPLGRDTARERRNLLNL